jgi:hypothetical protein
MISRSSVPGSDLILVTFTVNHDPEGPVSVVGDFNDWDPHATPMGKGKKGDRASATVRVPRGLRYQFRYLGGDNQWFNDETADDYADNEFGGQNSVLDLTADAIEESFGDGAVPNVTAPLAGISAGDADLAAGGAASAEVPEVRPSMASRAKQKA